MATDKTTSENLGDRMFEAAKIALGSKFNLVEAYLKAESEKLAITFRMIIEERKAGTISTAEARILLNQQQVATGAVLTTAEGMTAVAVQAALNAAFKVVRDFINGKVGFPLI